MKFCLVSTVNNCYDDNDDDDDDDDDDDGGGGGDDDMMMMIKIMIINNFLNGDERHEDGWKLCRLLLKICPKRPNFVGFFEKKIRTPPPSPHSKTCHP